MSKNAIYEELKSTIVTLCSDGHRMDIATLETNHEQGELDEAQLMMGLTKIFSETMNDLRSQASMERGEAVTFDEAPQPRIQRTPEPVPNQSDPTAALIQALQGLLSRTSAPSRIEPYEGKKADNADRWLSDFEDVAELNGWSGHEMYRRFKEHRKGPPENGCTCTKMN